MVLYATEDKQRFSLPLMKKMNTLFCIHFPPPPLNNDLKRMSLGSSMPIEKNRLQWTEEASPWNRTERMQEERKA